MKNVLPIKPCLAQKNVRVLHGECRQQILYLMLISKCLSNNLLFWHTGKFTASKIVESGRSKLKQQIEAVKKKEKKRKAFRVCIWKITTAKYPALVRRAMWKLIECDVNIRKFYLQSYYIYVKKIGIPWLLTTFYFIKA